jgi:hypothetical protein
MRNPEESSEVMSKRPKIKGRGVDIYLGGDAEQHLAPGRKKSTRAAAAGKGQTADKLELLSRPRESSCVDGIKRVVACQIQNSERLANQAIELQEQSAQWAKNTPLAPLFEAQTSIARKIVQRAAAAARNLWQIRDES